MCLFILLFSAHSAFAVGAHEYDNHVNTRVLVGSVKTNSAKIAVLCEIQPGWHIYGKESGDIGMPTQFWVDDTGVRDVTVHWPKPTKLRNRVGNQVLSSFTYGGVTVFPVTLGIRDRATRSVKLHMSFAVCGDVCIPQRRILEVTLPQSGFIDYEVMDLIRNVK
ncbi:protein-disulfide reductase DsbD family protein [Candidatus Anaplasma sp. TIGMIC]|nr:protein-disulfide reductase DsbD family protein [Candidatus Anaplasma sp. TIGMIC]